jgi:hypothetical protein
VFPSPYDVNMNELMQVDLGKLQHLSWIEELYIHVWLGVARERLANLLLHTAFISSPECLARHISQAESARWISHSSIPVRIPSPVMPANPDLPRSVGMPKILGPSTDSNPDASGRGTADSWDALYNLGFTARASPPFPRDILGHPWRVSVLSTTARTPTNGRPRPPRAHGDHPLPPAARAIINPVVWYRTLGAWRQQRRGSHTLPGRNGCVEYSRSGRSHPGLSRPQVQSQTDQARVCRDTQRS